MNRAVSWSLILLLIAGFTYSVSEMLAPFFISFIFAYLLHPLIEAIADNTKISRNTSTTLIFIFFLGAFITILILVTPVIYHQIADLIKKLPQYKNNIDSSIALWSAKMDHIDPQIASRLNSSMQSFTAGIIGVFSNVANQLWVYMVATINFFTIVALVPIILFYFLRDWNLIVASCNSLLPIKGRGKAQHIFHSINELLSAYVRGQLNICILLSVYYAIGLTLIGLDMGLLLGILTGFLIIIPFVGGLISFSTTILISYFAFGFGSELFYVLLLYVIGFITEGYIITPKVIGNRIGLHPVWIIFSVLASAKIFGFVGVLFAVPIAGIVKVLLINTLEYYKSSNIYNN